MNGLDVIKQTANMPEKRPNRLRTFALLASLALVPILSACTTVEGTNAFVDASTFEREVMNETLKGLGVLERENKTEIETARAPLVLPNQSENLPAPTDRNSDVLPEDSDTVEIDLTGISEEMLQRLRNARVVDLRSLSGRALTEAETRQLTAKMTADRLEGSGLRPLYLPPDRYFTSIDNQDLICLAANGDLVPLTDPRCPPAIRAALQGN